MIATNKSVSNFKETTDGKILNNSDLENSGLE